MLPVGTYTYQINVVSDLCGNIYNVIPALTATIQIFQQPVANAGSDKGVCNTLITNITALPSVGTGTWSQVSGPGTISFTPSATIPAVSATANIYGSYVVRWTETNAICTSSSDIIVAYERLATAGTAQNLCGTLSAVLQEILLLPGPAPGQKLAARVLSLLVRMQIHLMRGHMSAYGTYVLRWTLRNPVLLNCTTTSDVIITLEKPADAGLIQHLCGTFAATTCRKYTCCWYRLLVSGQRSCREYRKLHRCKRSQYSGSYSNCKYVWDICFQMDSRQWCILQHER